MKVALLASGDVGVKIAAFLGEVHPPACLILDSQDKQGRNALIVSASKVAPAHIHEIDRSGQDALGDIILRSHIELGICAWWPHLLKPSVVRSARAGFLNFHPSLLPLNRGKNPNFWTLAKATPAGVTIHWVDEGVDSGAIAFQDTIEVSWEDTGATLYAKSQNAIVELFVRNWPRIRLGDIPRIPQDGRDASLHRSHEMEEASNIDLEQAYTARDLLNLLRARTFRPHDGVRFTDNGHVFQVRVEIEECSGKA